MQSERLRGLAELARVALVVALVSALVGLGSCSDEIYSPTEPSAGSGGGAGEPGEGGGVGEGASGGRALQPSEAGAAGEGGATDPADSEPAPALLDSIVVEGVQVQLKPDFAPETRRYSVLASEPALAPMVTVTAAPELEIEVAGQPAQSGSPVELVDAEPGSEIEVEVQNSLGESAVYTIVYLPNDFPDITITTREPGASSDPIYVAPRGGGRFYVAKLNAQGVPLFYKKMPRDVGNFRKHPTGQYSYTVQNSDNDSWENVVLDENFEEVTRVTTVGLVDTDSHEFHILPNGNYIVMAYERAVHDLSEFGGGTAVAIVDAILQELSPDREVLFQWNSWDHLSYGDTVYEKSGADYSHINSIFVDVDGNWIISSRGLSQVFKIDRSTGEVLWRLGGKSNEFTFIGDPFGGLCGQHTATRVANGNLLLFDNGQSCWPVVPERGKLTRVVEYAIDEDAKTAELVFSFDREGAYTVSQGSAQRLDNGNTFIGWGLGFTALATEIDPEGNIVFEFGGRMGTAVANSYRAFRFPE